MKETLGNPYRAISLVSRDLTVILEQLINPMCFLKQNKTEKHTFYSFVICNSINLNYIFTIRIFSWNKIGIIFFFEENTESVCALGDADGSFR